jgi:hypothetical protein
VEDPEIIEKRLRCEDMIKELRKCLEYLNEARDYNIREDPMTLHLK